LKRARDLHYFRLPQRLQALKSDKELHSLRSRPDFQAFMATLSSESGTGGGT